MNSSQQFVFRWFEYAAAGAILLLAAKVAVGRLRQPADRINLILITFVAAAVVPLLVGLTPVSVWHLGLIESRQPVDISRLANASESAVLPATTTRPLFAREEIRQSSVELANGSIKKVGSGPLVPAVPAPERSDGWALATLGLLTIYGIVAALFAVEWFVGARRLRRMSTRAKPAGPALQGFWMSITEGRGDYIRLLVSDEVHTPLVFGCRQPTLIVPDSLAAGEPAALRFCLMHEWSHMENGDLRNWRLTWFCQFLLWFQPLFWLLRRELRVCQDFLADRRAAGAGRDRIEYSELLMSFARQRMGRPVSGAIAFLDRSSQLSRRIKMLLTPTLALRSRSPRAFCLAAGTLLLVCAALLGAVHLDSLQAGDDAQATRSRTSDERGTKPDSEKREDVEDGAKAKTKVVRGQVVDNAGMPVAGARLWLRLRYVPPRVVEGTTDEAGRFELAFPADWITPQATGSSWTIWAYAPGHSIGTASPFKVVRENSDEKVEIKLPPEGNTRFKIVTPTGEPLADALVQPQNYRTTVGNDSVPDEMLSSVSARTDAGGIATLPALEPKSLFRLQIVSDRFGKQAIRVDRDVEKAVRNIRLRETGRIEGRLVGERAEWLRGVKLIFSVDNDDEWNDPQGEARVVTDNDGRFQVPAIGSGGPVHTYVEFDPSWPVRPRLDDRIFLDAGATLKMEVPLVPAPKIRGKIQAKTSGKPIAKAEVSLGYGGFRQSDMAVTDDDGRFEGRALPGSVTAHIIRLPDGYEQLGEPWAESYQLPAGVQEFELPTIEVVRTHKLSGRLVGEKDQPLAAVQLMAVDKNRRYGFATTDAEGHFTMEVPEGIKTRIEVYTDERGQEPVEVVKQDPLVVRYTGDVRARAIEAERDKKPDVTFRGRVLAGGKPLSGVNLSLNVEIPMEFDAAGKPADPQVASRRIKKVADAQTDAEGRYRLSGVKAGESYYVEVKPPFPAVDPDWHHQMPWVSTLPDNAKGEVALPDMNLRKLTQSLGGKVVDPDGKPVEGATVSAQLRNGSGSLPRLSMSAPPPWTETDQEGRFKLQQLPDEPLAIMAYINPKVGNQIRFPAEVNVELNQQNIRIVLDPSLVEEEE